ncbi:hypothetical protein ACER0C_001700 [Sarotherodon galilaeus]
MVSLQFYGLWEEAAPTPSSFFATAAFQPLSRAVCHWVSKPACSVLSLPEVRVPTGSVLSPPEVPVPADSVTVFAGGVRGARPAVTVVCSATTCGSHAVTCSATLTLACSATLTLACSVTTLACSVTTLACFRWRARGARPAITVACSATNCSITYSFLVVTCSTSGNCYNSAASSITTSSIAFTFHTTTCSVTLHSCHAAVWLHSFSFAWSSLCRLYTAVRTSSTRTTSPLLATFQAFSWTPSPLRAAP